MTKIRINKNRIELLKTILAFKFIPIDGLAKISQANNTYKYPQNLWTAIRTLERYDYVKSYLFGNGAKVVFLTSKGKKF